MVDFAYSQYIKSRNVSLHTGELSEVYAFKTLYDYILSNTVQDKEPLQISFDGFARTPRAKEVLGERAMVPSRNPLGNTLRVGCYSDVSASGHLSIDMSILKNCTQQNPQEEKNILRSKYGVPSDLPVLVLSYISKLEGLEYSINYLSEFSRVYIVGDIRGFEPKYHDIKMPERVHAISKRGILKDFYAMADVSINATNLVPNIRHLHNFVEATEGGPLFMVPNISGPQYGYKQLVSGKSIVECSGVDDIISRVKTYITKESSSAKARLQSRADHIIHTREKYLPPILDTIQKLAKHENVKSIDTDLKLEVFPSQKLVITHPDTSWGGNLSHYEGVIHF